MNQETPSTVPPDHQLPATTSGSLEKRHSWRGWLILLFVLVLSALAIRHHHKKKAAGAASATPVSAAVAVRPATVSTGDLAVYLDAIGTVTPVYTDSMTAQVTGVITAVHYHEGQIVRKGDPLIDLDTQPFVAQLDEAKGTLEHDQGVLAQAKMDLARYREAWAGNGVSRQQLEDQEKIVQQDQGTVNFDLASVHYAQVQLNYCHIVAPISGRVGLRLVDPGNLVTANSTISLIVITQLSPTTVVFTLAQDDVARVQSQMRDGQQLQVKAFDRVQEQMLGTGKLITIDNQIDTTTGTVKLRAAFDNANGALFANQFVNTKLLLTTLHNQVLIPDAAIQHNGDSAFVYVLQDGKAAMREVKPGVSDNGLTSVQGLEPGQVIANSSFEKLQDGTEVTLSNVVAPAVTTASSEGNVQ